MDFLEYIRNICSKQKSCVTCKLDHLCNCEFVRPQDWDSADVKKKLGLDKNMDIVLRFKGTWIDRDNDRFPYRCSTCGNVSEHCTPFCPCCGTDLRELN